MSGISFFKPIITPIKSMYNRLPSMEVKKDKIIDSVAYIGRKWSSPQQRVVMGATAIFMQPFIDYHNKAVDEKTRKVSVARTIAKIVAGTLTGYAVRYACIKGIVATSKTLAEIPKNASPMQKKLRQLFTPKNLDPANKDAFAQYRNAMGTIVSLVVMLFTNFAIDAPLTKFLTNKLIKYQQEKGEIK